MSFLLIGRLVLATLIFSAGFAACNYFNQKTISELQGTIAEGNANLKTMQARAASALLKYQLDAETLHNNLTTQVNQLSIQHHEALSKNVSLSGQLSNARQLHARTAAGTSGRGCSRQAAKDRITPVLKTATAIADISARLDQLVDRNAKIADDNTEYATRAYQWAHSLPAELVEYENE